MKIVLLNASNRFLTNNWTLLEAKQAVSQIEILPIKVFKRSKCLSLYLKTSAVMLGLTKFIPIKKSLLSPISKLIMT